MMPSDALLSHFDSDLLIEQHWSAAHTTETSEAWLRNVDNAKSALFPLLAAIYGVAQAKR